jgi:hypothetical protein
MVFAFSFQAEFSSHKIESIHGFFKTVDAWRFQNGRRMASTLQAFGALLPDYFK